MAAQTRSERIQRSYTSGAVGEERFGERLDREFGGRAAYAVLHDRHVPGHTWNIDHLVVGPAGIFVIDAKNRDRVRVEVQCDPKHWRHREERLVIGGRRATREVELMHRQVRAVEDVIADLDLGPVRIHPMICFLNANIVSARGLVQGIRVLTPDTAVQRIREHGRLGPEQVAEVARHLNVGLPL